MSEPQKSRLRELVAFFGSTDEIAPIDQPSFARKLGKIIARACANMANPFGPRRKSKRKRHDESSE
jgi:hypothetical protein